MNSRSNISYINNFVDDDFCNHILDYCKKIEFKKAHQFLNGRRNKEFFFNNQSLIYNSRIFKKSLLKHDIKLKEWSSPIEIYKYEQSDFISAHYDSEERFSNGNISNYTAILYLNEDFNGGETFFPELEFSIKPKTGSLLLFEHHILHEAQVVNSGCKMIFRSNWLIEKF